jgi:hypothetical protein
MQYLRERADEQAVDNAMRSARAEIRNEHGSVSVRAVLSSEPRPASVRVRVPDFLGEPHGDAAIIERTVVGQPVGEKGKHDLHMIQIDQTR